jgi:hypothetical protein
LKGNSENDQKISLSVLSGKKGLTAKSAKYFAESAKQRKR